MNTTYTELTKIHKQFIHAQVDYWLHHVVFTFNWWFLVIICVLAWVIWWKTFDRKHIREIVLYGALVLIVTTIIDRIGNELLIWSYPIRLTPLYVQFIPVDFVAIPLIYMWLYQYFQTWRSFFIAIMLTSLVFSFGFEPLFTWMGIYDPIHWKFIYSYPCYIAFALGIRWVVKVIWRSQEP